MPERIDTKTVTKIDENGNKTEETTIKETRFRKNTEPDYIKIYTRMWCEFQGVKDAYKSLFLALAMRMSYCDVKNPEYSQIVHTSKLEKASICKELGWKPDTGMFERGIRELCKVGAIRKLYRATYQVNPSYAGKGPWLYDATRQQGGVKDLVAVFDFAKKSVATTITYELDDDDVSATTIVAGDPPDPIGSGE